MEIFVINLERSIRRRESICRQLDQLGLKYRIFTGTDGNDFTDEEISQLCDPKALAQYGFTRGKIGCVYTKYRLYRTIAEEQIEAALILEDDLQLPPNLPALLPRLEAELQPDEILLLLGLPTGGCQFSTQDRVTVLDDYQLAYPMDAYQVVSATAFMLRWPLARRLADRLLPIHTCSDWWGVFQAEGGLDAVRCLLPSPIQLNLDFPSDIRTRQARHPVVKAFRDFVNEHQVFPLSSLLAWNRRRATRRMLALPSTTNERSPMALRPSWAPNGSHADGRTAAVHSGSVPR